MSEPAVDEGEEPAKGGGKLLIVGLVLGLLLGGGAAAGFFIMTASSDTEVAEAEPEPAPKKEKAELTDFLEVNRVTVPILGADKRVRRYVQLDLRLAVAETMDLDFISDRKPVIRHVVLQAASQKSFTGGDRNGRFDYDLAAKVLKGAINDAMGQDIVKKVFVVNVAAA